MPVLGYGFAGDGFNCCQWVETDEIWSLIFGFVQWVSVGCRVGFRSISVGVWFMVARGGGSYFWSFPVVLGVFFFFFFVAPKHSVEYFLKHFPRMPTNIEKKLFYLKIICI